MYRIFANVQPQLTKKEKDKNKKLLRKVEYTFGETQHKDEWYMGAFEASTRASVDILVFDKDELIKPEYNYPVPGTPQEFKVYIMGLFAGTSKGIVRVMLCQLLTRAMIKFKDRINGNTHIYLHACGKGPTGKYKDLIKMYRNMGFEPCGVSDAFNRLKEALDDPRKFDNDLHMQTLNCKVYLQQKISNLLRWCMNYFY